nr:flavodoxin [uncultured Carboxylicivirga sp.]
MSSETNNGNCLVAYFSWSGNTFTIAKQIAGLVGGDLFEIKPIDTYSQNYGEVVKRARQEIKMGETPELVKQKEQIEKYDVVFIGYPNWCDTFPAPVLTFLTTHDLRGKKVIPFCTHGGGGVGRSFSELAKQCIDSEVLKGISIDGYVVNENNVEIKDWIEKLTI